MKIVAAMMLSSLITSFIWYFIIIIDKKPERPIIAQVEAPPAFRNTKLPQLNTPLMKNGCYLAASEYKDMIKVQDSLAKRNHWAKILYVNIVEKTGHAACIFHYDGEWHAYDCLKGTVSLGKYLVDPTPQEIASRISDNYKDAFWMTEDPSK